MNYAAFYGNPTIQRLAAKPKWTVSNQDKIPLDMFELSVKHNCCGAVYGTVDATMPLAQVDNIFRAQGIPSNHTFFLDVMEDDIVVLDIEPSCPQEIKDRLLKFPYIYGETSMSGHGLHLVFPKPRNFDEFEAARVKVALKGENKHYEILMNHWVTFTGNTIDPAIAPNCNDQSEFEAFYAKLAVTQVKTVSETPFNMGDLELENIPYIDQLLDILINANPFKGKLENYDNDLSRWELAWTRSKYEHMMIAMHVDSINPDKHMYTLQERAAILNEVCKRALPHRPKHDTWHTPQFNTWYEQLVYKVISSNTREDDPAYIANQKECEKYG